MNNQKNSTLILLILIAASIACTPKEEAKDTSSVEEWIQLFNGKDMDGWTPKLAGYPAGENFNNTFRVENGELSASYTEYDTFKNEFGHLFYKEKFSHYRLRSQYRFMGEQVNGGEAWAFRNNGLMLHSQSAESMNLDQGFPISIELQLLASNGEGERPTGNLCTPGLNVVLGDSLFVPHCISSTSKTYPHDQWVNVEALVLGDSLILHIVEGDTVMAYSKPTIGGEFLDGIDTTVFVPGAAVAEGYITIQAESHPTQFKKIELLNLCGCMDPKASNYKSYYVKDDPKQCQY